MTISTVPDLLEDYRQGKMVIITDDEDRENEGDVFVAAERVQPHHINFMATNARGLVCLTLTAERCDQLGLALMVGTNASRFSTNFTLSIEASSGVTTGISAADRATTVHAAIKKDAGPEDIISPGHIFPIMAQPGGVLTRAGHTEAGVDLARLAGFEPASVICEILNSDGNMARFPDLNEFAQRHELKISSVAELIRYRLKHEPTVERIATAKMSTHAGEFDVHVYRDVVGGEMHIAMVKGEIDPASPTMVRVQVESGILDVFRELQQVATWTVSDAASRISQEGNGVLVILRYQEEDDEIVKRVRYADAGGQGIEFPWREAGEDLRVLGVGGQILADLGVGKMNVLGNPRKMHALSGFGLEPVDYIPR